jgi:hypothetical protein
LTLNSGTRRQTHRHLVSVTRRFGFHDHLEAAFDITRWRKASSPIMSRRHQTFLMIALRL